MLYLHSDDYISLNKPKNIVHYEYIRDWFCYYILATLDRPFITIHPTCGKIETLKVLVSARGLSSLSRFNKFPKEVLIFAPSYLNKKDDSRCKNVLAIGTLYEDNK